MAKVAPPPGMKPLFGSSASAAPAATAKVSAPPPTTPTAGAADLVFIEPRPYCTWSSKTVRWKGHGSALVRDKLADPRMGTKDYAKDLKRTDDYADSDADLRIVTVLRGGTVKFTKRCAFPVVHIGEGLRVDLTLAAYASEKGDAVLFVDSAFGLGDVVYAGDKPDLTAVVNKPKAPEVTLMAACFNYDHPEMKAYVVSDPELAKLVGTLRAMREAVGDEETREVVGFAPVADAANEYLRKELTKCQALGKMAPSKKKLLNADQLDWPKIAKAALSL